MDSDTHHHQHHRNQEQQQQNMNSGLTRYRSAPSSYFSNMINSGMYGEEDLDPFFNNRISSPETEGILARFISGGDNLSSHQNLNQIQGNDFMGSMKHKQENYSSQSQEQQQMMYQNHGQSHEIVHNIVSSSPMVDPPTNLDRQSSSPAGFFEHNNIDNGYSMMRSMNKFHPANGSIPEHDGRTMSCNNGGFEETHTKAGGYSVASIAGGSWDESSMLGDRFLNGFVESDHISSTEDQEQMNDEGRFQSIHASTGLSHQLSLPTSSTELDRLSRFQDNVPFRSRAKRGCATHPRSIAERVRRTRISERMRKLQDLVPNMDKQTSTADMLDLAVDYIKELQNQVETLSDRRTKCTCRKLKL